MKLCYASVNGNRNEKSQPSSTGSEGNGPTNKLNVSCLLCTPNMVFIVHHARQLYCCHQFLRQSVVSVTYNPTYSYMLYTFLLIMYLSRNIELRKE